MDTSGLDFNAFPAHPEQSVDSNYRGMRIKVYRNGDQYDIGTTVFAEIEAGESYVAVSQGPFLHKPYGLPPEGHEKWNISPKIESPEQSTLGSAESVDIYLKQRGYTSRTGLPFPFDGGVCVNHSFMDLGLNRDPSSNLPTHQHRNEQKPEENIWRNGESLEENDKKSEVPRKEQQKSDSQAVPHSNSGPATCYIESLGSVAQVKSNAPLCETATPGEEHDNILSHPMAENNLYKDPTTHGDCKPSVKEYDECGAALQIPDRLRDFLITQDAENCGSLRTMQTTNALATKKPETVMTVANDETMITEQNKTVMNDNVSEGQKRCDPVNSSESADNAQISLTPANKVAGAQLLAESPEVKVAPLSDGARIADPVQDSTEVKRPIATLNDNAPSATTTDRSSSSANIKDQELRTVSSKNAGDERGSTTSSKSNLKEYSDNVFIERNSKEQRKSLVSKFEKSWNFVLEQNLRTKLKENPNQEINSEMEQVDNQVRDTFKNNTTLAEVSKNLTEPKSLPTQRSESRYISDNFGHDKENGGDRKSQLSHANVIYGCKAVREDAASNSNKVQDSAKNSSGTNRNLRSGKHVNLATSRVVDIDLETKLRNGDSGRGLEEQLRPPKPTATSTTSATTATVISGVVASNSMTDITHAIAASRDALVFNTEGRTEVPNQQQKYRLPSETTFEPDFTPRDGQIQISSAPVNSYHKIKIDFDLNIGICGLSSQSGYDPDFKDFDFI